ncbi:MAG TPA: polyprenyl synthetase family protein, partial [Galbitalea sp.]
LLYLRRMAETDSDARALLQRIDRDVNAAFYNDVESPELTAAIAELRDHEVTRMTLAEAHRWSADAIDALSPLPDGPVKKALTRFAETIVERSN